MAFITSVYYIAVFFKSFKLKLSLITNRPKMTPFKDPIEHETTSEEMVEMKRTISSTETQNIYDKIPFIEKDRPSSENKAYIGKG